MNKTEEIARVRAQIIDKKIAIFDIKNIKIVKPKKM